MYQFKKGAVSNGTASQLTLATEDAELCSRVAAGDCVFVFLDTDYAYAAACV